ncbi:glycoside hydrolase family 3 C-terminal domain-containing protein [Demequina sp. NBRC 110054]|uniref:glycoside hydrolase family 3 protein n=1 Tax=Demequina sp. NBRC 110054 TaxID=1570343 RepID=UPI0009FF3F81|nr:glycoside hydrolase family 3 C-terminal domain-containing protein [Demequina sp. NBRC 110054]
MSDDQAYPQAVSAVRDGASAEDEARGLYARLNDDERLGLLDGDREFWEAMDEMMHVGYNTVPYVHGEVARLGIPGLRFTDGPRGIVMGHSTAFPVSMARGASFDLDLEERIGRAIGLEARAQGANFFAGVCVNLLRHPAWGRAQETYGEDTHVLGEMGAALTRGVREQVMACAKHFALNSMENARFQVDVVADDDVLHEIYLAHFKRIVDEGADALMSSYNSVNGEWAGQNPELLTGVLRDMWGFEGVVVSDFILGLRDAAASLEAGLDVEEPFRQQRARDLEDGLAQGQTSWAAVERSGVRILATQLRFDASHDAPIPSTKVIACDAHRALAREAASTSMVLLKNDDVDGAPVLPLDRTDLKRVAVIGRLADMANTGDHGSSDVHAPTVVTPLEGLRAALPGVEIVEVLEDDPVKAATVAKDCDAAIVVAGFTAKDEGEFTDASAMFASDVESLYPPRPDADPEEPLLVAVAGGDSVADGGDRIRLTLRPVDEAIILAVADANPRTIVSMVAAGAVISEAWRHEVPGIVMSWYSGMEGGHALADVLLGEVDPGGRLPFAVPTTENHLPFFDRDATCITYDRWHGQRLLDRLGVAAAYPFGHGLSYTDFDVAVEGVRRLDDAVAEIDVAVTNVGARRGRHVVQVYAVGADGGKHLVGFQVADVEAGATTHVTVPVSLLPAGGWDPDRRAVVPPHGPVTLLVARDSRDAEALEVATPAP